MEINKIIELVSTEEKKNYVKKYYEKIQEDFLTEIKNDGINTYEFPVFHDEYIAHMTDEQLEKTVEFAIDILEELKKQNNEGLNKSTFNEKVSKAEVGMVSHQICLNDNIRSMVHSIDEMFLLNPFDAEIIVNQELYSVIFAIYFQLVDNFDNEMYGYALDLLIRGIMRMGYEPVQKGDN